MQAGTLRHRIEIQRATDTQGDTFGEARIAWVTFARVWAEVLPTSGQERFNNDQVEAGVTHAVTIRYLAGVTPKMRVMFKGREFQIESVVNIEERNRTLRLMCVERLA